MKKTLCIICCHARIDVHGKIIFLENLWEFGDAYYKDDPERTQREKQEQNNKNDKIRKIIQEKGIW